jgi:hypothetical protein
VRLCRVRVEKGILQQEKNGLLGVYIFSSSVKKESLMAN